MPAIAVDGVELFHRSLGDGPAVLLIHGMGGDADVWGEAFEMLGERRRVIAYDRRGFTRSAHAPVDDLEVHREDAAALLGALDAAPAVVVGWSSGGLIALDLAVRRPELVAGLVLVEAPLHASKRPGLRQARAAIAARVLSRVKDDAAGSEVFLRWALRYSTGGTAFDRLDESMREAMLANGRANMAELRAGTAEHLSREEVATLRAPVVCLVGELSDRAFSRATGYVAGLVPGARVVRVAGAGHAIHLERPGEFVAAVREVAAPS